MREIKFRGWWKDTLKPIPDFMEQYTMDVLNTDKDNLFFFSQFTGLKDKNGKEIWEGDILRLDGGADYESIINVVWDTHSGQWHCVVPWLEHEKKTVPLEAYTNKSFCSVTVIGNIYENPELLDK